MVLAIGIQGWVDPSLASRVDAYEEVGIGQLGRLIERLRARGVRQAIMAGKVTKEVLFEPRAGVDAEMRGILSRVQEMSVPALLGAIAERLSTDGIALLDSSTFLQASLCPIGVLTTRRPTPAEARDIEFGGGVARQLAELDIGQTVIVKEGVVVAVEALEGTDAAIRRAHALAGGSLVVVKTAAHAQDRRFDLPVIGPETLETLRTSGAVCLAVEAGVTVLLDRERIIAEANASNLCLLGITVNA